LKEEKIEFLESLSSKKSIRINFICSGNIIRSPYAEILFEHLIKKEKNAFFHLIHVESGGVRYRNSDISTQSAEMLFREGVSQERINQFTPRYFPDYPSMFDSVDLILVMERSHLRSIPLKFSEKAFLLLEFVYGKNEDVPDPYFDPPYEKAYNMIKKALIDLIEIINNNLESGMI
jgi:protein-tyrosine phosphatase